MSAHAAPAPSGPTLSIAGRAYPILLPKLRDPRLHLAATITSLQVLGQVAFAFRVSIAQIAICLVTCAVLEVGIAAWRQHVILWPASALLTGNGVAFVLRVPGTRHGDWWSTRGWWIFAGTAAVALLSKHVVRWRGAHVFNPSNFGLVFCFLILGRGRVEPLDFWWGPMSPWMGLALAIILAGGFAILSRLKLLWIAVAFWATFAAGVGALAVSGHAMSARWHLGPVTGFGFWWALVTSPEVLVFLFFMITDPKTAPRAPRARLAYAVSLGLLAALFVAPTRTEWASKVGLLSSLFVVCASMPLLRLVRLPRPSAGWQRAALLAGGLAAAYTVTLVALGHGPGAASARPLPPGQLPPITILPSRGVESQLSLPTAQLIAHDLVSSVSAQKRDRLRVWLEPGGGQKPPRAVAELAGRTYRLEQAAAGHWAIATANVEPAAQPSLPAGPVLAGYGLRDVAPLVGLNFRQGSFRYGVTNDEPAMMGGGLCWIDYDNDGWLDLFVVNSYADANLPAWQRHGGLPRSTLFHNEHGRFVDVSAPSHANVQVRGEGCVAADLDGDGHTDLYVTTATDDVLLWNNGDGTFTEGARKAGVVSFGWHAGAAITDVNGDGRLDLFVAGYADVQHPIPSSVEGFPGNYPGVRDLLFLHQGGRHFKEVGALAGLDRLPYDHSLGAVFGDFADNGRPALYVANDEDPNRLYVNERGGPLGFHFVERARSEHVADANAGMGIAAAGGYVFVTNSRKQTHAAYLREGSSYTDVRRAFRPAFGANLTGWGDSWVDLRNDGTSELLVANGAIPVTNLAKDAAPLQVLTSRGGRWVDTGLLRKLRLNGRGLAAADYDNDGRVDVAVNTIGGKLRLLRNTSKGGHWLEVRLDPYVPGTIVTVGGARGTAVTREAQAGSSYLSSEDPRLHFGLGSATHARTLKVLFPSGEVRELQHVRGDRVVTIRR